ncbi:MAG: iron-containing alcohol dehydrogenase [Defluviitaleaceae bacterium]|nr:iron-containing alcohol dehydrogenase [Defluviitaleaceae bacterium]
MYQLINFAVPNVVFGMDTADATGDEAAKLGAKRALLISGPNVHKAGNTDKVLDSLKKAGIEAVLRIEERTLHEPTSQSAEAAAQFAKSEKVDCIIGLGGGSVIDVAKMAAVLVVNPGGAAEYFGVEKVPQRGLPTIMIPTTAGTSAEVTKIAVFLDEATNVKKVVASGALLPNTAIIDPKLTLSCPPTVTANSGIDAFIHAAESFVSTRANPITDSLALGSMEMIAKWIGKAYARPDDLDARYYMSMGSVMAGMVMGNSGTSLVHALSYPIGGEYHINHGRALMPILLSCFDYIMVSMEDKFVQMAHAMGEDVEHLPQREAAKLCLEALEHMCKRLDLPTCFEDMGITDKSRVDQWAIDAYAERRLLGRCARELTVEDCKKIYLASFRD